MTGVMDDMLRIMDQIERVDPLVDARRYAVVFMSRDRYLDLLNERMQMAGTPPWTSGQIPLFGYPVRVEEDGPDEPIVQFRMTASQLIDVIESARRRDVFTFTPPPAPAPTLRGVLRKWWKRYRPS